MTVEAIYRTPITELNFTGITVPVAYMPLQMSGSATATLLFDSDDADTEPDTVTWTNVSVVWATADAKAVYGKTYTGTITLQDDPARLAVFADEVTVTGIPGATSIKATKQGNTLTFTPRELDLSVWSELFGKYGGMRFVAAGNKTIVYKFKGEAAEISAEILAEYIKIRNQETEKNEK